MAVLRGLQFPGAFIWRRARETWRVVALTSPLVRRESATNGRLRAASVLAAIILDVAVGQALLWELRAYKDVESATLVEAGANAVGSATTTARALVSALVDSPLKLNAPLTRVVVGATQYVLDTWAQFTWTCIVALSEHIARWLPIVVGAGPLVGISLCQDLVVMLTVHVQCSFVYSRALHQFTVAVLASSFRLFRGLKANPLRNRIDSCDYDTSALLFGTMILSISLFLYPTVLAVFVVFFVLWASAILVVTAGGLVLALYHGVCAGTIAVCFEIACGRQPGVPRAVYTTNNTKLAGPQRPTIVYPPRPLTAVWVEGFTATRSATFLPDQSLVFPSA
eukprot:m.111260 g.111260  ORF g.111260 m.111260 type:complete len:338 (+) comp12920_c0_seq2:257-1270(+)